MLALQSKINLSTPY